MARNEFSLICPACHAKYFALISLKLELQCCDQARFFLPLILLGTIDQSEGCIWPIDQSGEPDRPPGEPGPVTEAVHGRELGRDKCDSGVSWDDQGEPIRG